MRKKNIIKNILLTLLLQFITVICGFIVPRMIIQTFGSNVNGLVSSITQFLSYIVFLEAGIGPVVKSLLYKPIAENDKVKVTKILKSAENFFKTISIIFIVYLSVLTIVLPMIMKEQFNILYTASLIIIISVSTFMEYYMGMVYKLYLQAVQKKYIVSLIQIITTIINTVMVVLLIKLGANIQVVKLVSTSIFVIRPIVQNLYVKKKYKINLKEEKNVEKIEQKWDGLAQHVASIIHTNTDVSILTIFVKNISEVSVYSVYYMVVKGVKQIIDAFSTGVMDSFGDMFAKNEKEKLNKGFSQFEFIYYSISTIAYMATLILIVPFVKVYTKGIEDVNYLRYSFSYLLVIGEFIWVIRQPYNNLIKVAGHFKQTQIGAWIEAILNLVISIILVQKYGIVGVAIGTLISILIRTVEIIIYTSRHILQRKISYTIKRIVAVVIESIIILIIVHIIPQFSVNSYFDWIKYALTVLPIIAIVVIVVNFIFDRENIKNIFKKNKC